ncbi:MAG: flotillin family protein [Bacteroidales bacterium]|nr:flotillin family protein [Bacteroidales bacterium]
MVILVVIIAICLLVFIVLSYVKTSPNQALVISGWPRKTPKFLIGTGGIRIPFLQKIDKLYLGQLSVDIKTDTSVPTSDFINVDVDAVAKVRINPNLITIAAANFLGKTREEIAREIKDSLQGNMREIIGTQDLRSLNNDRDGFSNQIQDKAAPDMEKLGIEILSCNIQSITDNEGLIHALGADNTCKITKDASINKANAERDVEIAKAQAAKEANDARVLSQKEIAEKNTELEIKKAELKKESDIQKAIADNAYQIQFQDQLKIVNVKTVDANSAKLIREQEQQKEINRHTVEAEIERAKQEQLLREQEISIQEKMLQAQINKKADAEKYEKEINAAAELEQRKRKAEAERYEAEQAAMALKAKAEAELYAQQQKAAGIKTVGEAEAAAIRAKGEAEAAAMDKKAEAYKKYGQAALAEMVVNVLPSVAEKIAAPISTINDVHVYGTTGTEAAGLSGNVPVLMKQTIEVVKNATGVDLSAIMQDNSKVMAGSVSVDKE